MDNRMERDTAEYWNAYGSVWKDSLLANDDAILGDISGFVFTGRVQFRSDLVFHAPESFDCNKKYPRSKRLTPGILNVISL